MIFQILYHIKFPSVRIRCYHNRPIIKKMRYLLSLKAAAHFFWRIKEWNFYKI